MSFWKEIIATATAIGKQVLKGGLSAGQQLVATAEATTAEATTAEATTATMAKYDPLYTESGESDTVETSTKGANYACNDDDVTIDGASPKTSINRDDEVARINEEADTNPEYVSATTDLGVTLTE